jgi:iron complex outermembrane receptor protein
MKFLYFLLIGFLFISEASAQSKITGKISSLEGEDPLMATIYFPKLERGEVADFDGNYSIDNIPAGIHTVVYSLLGYATVSMKLNFQANETTVKDIKMVVSVIEMQEVIVSTPFHQLQRDNVMKVERISVDDLSAQGAVNLADGITAIPGVSSISTGIGIGKPVIRGLSSNRVLTYSQGVRLENQQFGDEHGLGINEAGIESVEVIKGPASLLYGSDALGGVLYINPERFAKNGEFLADLNSSYASNTTSTSINLGAKFSGERLKFLVRGARLSHSDYKTGNDYRVTNSRFNEKDLKTGIGLQNSTIKSTFRYNYNRANIGIPEEIGIQTLERDPDTPFQEIDNHILSLENKLFFSSSSLDLKLGYVFNDRREYENFTFPSLQLKLKTFNYDVKYNLPEIGKFETIVGLQGMFQSNTNFGEEILIPDATIKDIGLMATAHYHLEKVDIQAGLRFDHRALASEAARNPSESDYIPAINRNYNSFNAALGAKMDFLKNISGRLNLASGFRAPNLAELTSNGVHEGTNRYEIGNSDLTNEQNFQTDLSLEFRNDHFEISANGFYNAINNYIFISPTNSSIHGYPVFDYLQNDAHLYGGEIGVHIHPHPLDWLHINSSFETVTGELNDGGYLPLIPANSLKNTLQIDFKDGRQVTGINTFVSFENTFAQNKTSAFETSSTGYNLLSIGGGCTFMINNYSLVLGINATNLANVAYVSHLSRLKSEGIENIGRNINASVKVKI